MINQIKFKNIAIEKISIFFVFHRIEKIPIEFDSISIKQFINFVSLVNYA